MAGIILVLTLELFLFTTSAEAGQFRRLPPSPTTPPAEPPAKTEPSERAPGRQRGWGEAPGTATHPDGTPGAGGNASGTEAGEFVIREDVRLVRADVQVADKGQIVDGLTQSDFVLFDNGRATPITDFGEETDPVDLVMLLDVSGSMTSYLQEVSRAAGVALNQLMPEDRVGVMIFSKQGKLLNGLTSERADVLTSLRSLTRLPEMAAGTAINASIMDAIKIFEEDAAAGNYDARRRRAILILTDNWGLNYKMPDRRVLRELQEQSISLNAIVVGRVQKPTAGWKEADDDLAEELDFSPANVFRLAEETGGEIFTSLEKDKGLGEILSRIRTRYSLYFKPPANAAPGTFRKIRVELAGAAARAHRKAEIRVRAGYFTR
ncbi:MAG: VWA domain-containing protein [Bryobacterales bacterium]|nr:VWA domain-containing protein [Bryobacterales bacterium]